MKPLIVGCGTADRGDDAAGLAVARRLREWGVQARQHSGDGLALMELWERREFVILIDAVVAGGLPGSISTWNAADAPLAADVFRGTHAFGIAEAVKLARELGRMPARLVIYGIEARRFELGAGLSPGVAAAVENVARSILKISAKAVS